MSDRISPSTEGHAFLIQIQKIISVAFGQPHVYKNFWFGAKVYPRPPTMLFGHISLSDVEVTTLECPMRLFDALIKNEPLGLIALDNVIDSRSEQLSKVTYQK